MGLLRFLISVLAGIVLTACSSAPSLEMSGWNVTVRVDERVSADPRKKEAMEEYSLVPWLHHYITHRFQKLKLKSYVETTVTVTDLRLKTGKYSGGTSNMTVHVVAADGTKTLEEFDTSVSTTKKREKAVRIMSKEAASYIYNNVKDL